MENVQFDEEPQVRTRPAGTVRPTGIIGFLIKKGLARDTKGAQYILLGIALVALIASFFLWRPLLSEPVVDPASIPPMPGYNTQ